MSTDTATRAADYALGASEAERANLLLVAGQVLPGPAGQRIADGAVLVAGERSAAVGPRVEVERRAPPAVTTLRYPSGTVLPGLIDAHVHLAFDAGPDPVSTLLASDGVDLAAGMAVRARQLRDSGVTTVRDLGDRGGHAARLRDAIIGGACRGRGSWRRTRR